MGEDAALGSALATGELAGYTLDPANFTFTANNECLKTEFNKDMAALLSDNAADRFNANESFTMKNPSRSELAMRGLWPPSGWHLAPKLPEAEAPIAVASRPQTGKPRLQVRLRGPLPVLDEPSGGRRQSHRSESSGSRPPSAAVCSSRSVPTLGGVAAKSAHAMPNSLAAMRPASAAVSRGASWVMEPALEQVARTGRLPSATSATRQPYDGQAVFKGA